MSKRINILKESPEAYQAMAGLEEYLHKSGLDSGIYELVKIRASQINGCAYCLNMHTRDARKLGETDQRMHLLRAWRETDLYTPQEQAALALTEAMTLIAKGPVPDAIYEEAARHFGKSQLSALMMAIVAINGWNRIAIVCESELD